MAPRRPVIQQDRTGCGIAAVAALAGEPYAVVKARAASLGISVGDPRLWSSTGPVRRLLRASGWQAGASPRRFRSWSALPAYALLAIRWHRERGRPHWHWVVFEQAGEEARVLDSKRALRAHVRRDFWRMKPKWYLAVRPER